MQSPPLSISGERGVRFILIKLCYFSSPESAGPEASGGGAAARQRQAQVRRGGVPEFQQLLDQGRGDAVQKVSGMHFLRMSLDILCY